MALLCRQHINQPVFPIILSMEIRVDNNLVIISQNLCNCFDILMTFCLFQQLRGKGMPLRYNYDKPEKPRRIKGFEVFSLIFSSFSKPKNHTEISRIIGGVSLTTNE